MFQPHNSKVFHESLLNLIQAKMISIQLRSGFAQEIGLFHRFGGFRGDEVLSRGPWDGCQPFKLQ
jgi:hypothetical protein